MTEYQTFGFGPSAAPGLSRQSSTGSRSSRAGSERFDVYRRYPPSISRLIWFACILLLIALLLLGPISFVVAFIRLNILPAGFGGIIPIPPNNGNDQKQFILNVEPVLVEFPTMGPQCRYWIYSYGGTQPGPSIYVDSGSRFEVEVVNTLGQNPPTTLRQNNQLRFPNTTSTHFHGLHASPVGRSDNVFAEVEPGKSFTHLVHLRRDHPAGTYYIHPHLHGSAGMQTAFAMASPLIVRDRDEYWRNIPEEIFTIQRGGLHSTHAADDARAAFGQNEGFIQPSQFLCETKSFVLVNGYPQPLSTRCDSLIRRWRIINAAMDGGLVLRFHGTCEVKVIARDGVYLSEGLPKSVNVAKDVFVVPPGGRIDFLIKGDETCSLSSEPNSEEKIRRSLGPKTALIEAKIAQCVQINVSGTFEEGMTLEEGQQLPSSKKKPQRSLTEFPDTLPTLPEYMDDLRRYSKAERRVLEWTEFNKNFTHGVAKYGINGEAYSNHSRFTIRLDRVQEWLIVNAIAADNGPAVESHSFHLHTNHFQIVGFSGNTLVNGEDYTIGQWRDTVYVPTPGNLTIRWIPRHFTGKSLLHCHTLSHEDTGMSWPFDIVPKL